MATERAAAVAQNAAHEGAATWRTMFDLGRFFADVGWAAGEYMAKIASDPVLRRLAPKSAKPHAVLTLPGFSGPEVSLAPLNAFLNRQGFIAESWGLGTNRGPRQHAGIDRILSRLHPKLKRLSDQTEAKVSLVGQSLGGVYAREIAREWPELVSRVITLGSPAYMHPERLGDVNAAVSAVFAAVTGRRAKAHFEAHAVERLHAAPPGVPLVCIYSPLDGVVGRAAAAIPGHDLTFEAGAPRENIAILGSHCGMGVNPIVLVAICDRLAADADAWTPFDAAAYLPAGLKLAGQIFYPLTAKDQGRHS